MQGVGSLDVLHADDGKHGARGGLPNMLHASKTTGLREIESEQSALSNTNAVGESSTYFHAVVSSAQRLAPATSLVSILA